MTAESSSESDTPTTPQRSRISQLRAVANVTAGVLAFVLLIGFALGPGHIPEWVLGRIGALAVFAFLVGFVAILIENRTAPPEEDEW